MLGDWISRRWPLKWRSERTERGGSGKWKLGQVRVTKHGIHTLPFQRRGQARCMWAGPCICIRRILRMWDPATVRNPMQDPSLPAIQCQWWGVCLDVSILDGTFNWLITASLGKVLRVYLELFKVLFFFWEGFSLLFAPVVKSDQSQLCDPWNNWPLSLLMSSRGWPKCPLLIFWQVAPLVVPLTSPDLLPSGGTWGHHDSSPWPVIAACNLY